MNQELLKTTDVTGSYLPAINVGNKKEAIERRLKQMEEQQFVLRLWSKDATLWGEPKGSRDIVHSLGWLSIVEKMIAALPMLWKFEAEVKAAGFKHVMLLGMGGSSLSAFVFQQMTGSDDNGIPVSVLDTTDPETILQKESEVDLSHTLFIVASKSGGTTEPQALFEYFYDRVKQLKGDQAGAHFVAITDPNTILQKQAAEFRFRHVFLNYEDIGGRFSALSYFGLVPAVLMGVNVGELLERILLMVQKCSAGVPIRQNPGVYLGGVIGELARTGSDKLTFFLPEKLKTFGWWLEQLIAESTGKRGSGIVPVTEEIDLSAHYGKDRAFVFINFTEDYDKAWIDQIKFLEDEGFPVIKMEIEEPADLGQEFFKWEVATSIAGAVLNLNPFDQPNVQESKDITASILKNLESGTYREVSPLFSDKELSFYGKASTVPVAEDFLQHFFSGAKEGEYVALLAYLPETAESTEALDTLKSQLEEGLNLPVSYSFGPRYLHSTGQLYKGGADNGYYIIFTGGNKKDIQIPGKKYSFGKLKNAQASGDFEALINHKRRVIRIDLGQEFTGGLETLKKTITEFLPVQLKFV